MRSTILSLATSSVILMTASVALAGTEPFFTPLTQSAPVTVANSAEEATQPWTMPAGLSQVNWTSMDEIESAGQTVVRAPFAGTSASMWDMSAFDYTGRFLFTPHEVPWRGGVSRYDSWNDTNTVLFSGDDGGLSGDWSNDWAAFDPATFTPNCTVFAGEEWSGEGRIIETMNPYAPADDIQIRELETIANVSHEGLRFSADGGTLYYVDEWRSGSIYKIVFENKNDYAKGGQTFVLAVDAFKGEPKDNYSDASNAGQPRTGMATWTPITDAAGNYTTTVDPFRNGPTNDPRTNNDTRGGRPAADEVNGTPYGRPEDMEVGTLDNGNEVIYFAATSEQSVYSIEEVGGNKAMVRLMVGPSTPTNQGFAATTGVLNSPDNLAQDALGNIYIIEDAPNGSSTGGDIWFVRDVNNDGVAESIDHFLSNRVAGSESTGMIWNPQAPTQFTVNLQHPASTNLDAVPDGYGDATWMFDVAGSSDRKFLRQLGRAGTRAAKANHKNFTSCAGALADQYVTNDEPYIQINNGSITTNAGQQFQVVVQYGNKSTETIKNARLWCSWNKRIGTLGSTYAHPFTTVHSDSFRGDNFVGFGAKGIYNVSAVDNVDLIAGQNYNASFDIKVASNAGGKKGDVTCVFYGDGNGPIATATTSVTVQ